MIPVCYATSFSGTTVAKGWSDYHYFEFVQHPTFGLCLFLDGILQSSEYDQNIYHKKLVQAAFAEQKVPADVLIIGGAGGGALHQIRCVLGELKCRVTVVDIDEKLFAISRKLMKKWRNGELENPVVNLIFANGRDFLRETELKFDAVILDVGDPLPFTKSNDIYTPAVLRDISEVLRPDGVVSFHSVAEHASDHIFVKESINGNCAFKLTSQIQASIPSFERLWMFHTLKKRSARLDSLQRDIQPGKCESRFIEKLEML